MSEHTPGPWGIRGPSPGKGTMDDGGDYAIMAGGQIIGEAIHRSDRNVFQPVCANARLIAACPMMYDYVKSQADNGDSDASEIIKSING